MSEIVSMKERRLDRRRRIENAVAKLDDVIDELLKDLSSDNPSHNQQIYLGLSPDMQRYAFWRLFTMMLRRLRSQAWEERWISEYLDYQEGGSAD